MRAVLIGSESLLVSCGEFLRSTGHDVVAVLSDSPVVRDWAARQAVHTLSVSEGYAGGLTDRPFDVLLSITNLTVVPPALLSLPRVAAVNFHDGPLPRYGGLNAPVWARLAGEHEHGISWHLMTAALDEGAVLVSRRFPIEAHDTALTLNTRCFQAAIDSFPELVERLTTGDLNGQVAPLDLATYRGLSARLPRAGLVDLGEPVEHVVRWVRALDFGGYRNRLGSAMLCGRAGAVIVRSAEVATTDQRALAVPPGTLLGIEADALCFATGTTPVCLSRLASLDGTAITAPEAARILGVQLGSVLGGGSVEALESFVAATGRHEAWWVRQLAATEPLRLPGERRATATPHDEERAFVDLPMAADAEQRLRRAVLVFARLADRDTIDVGFVDMANGAVPAAWTGALAACASPVVPLHVTLPGEGTLGEAEEAVRAALVLVRTRGGFLRDLPARWPELAAIGDPVRALSVRLELVDTLEHACPEPAQLALVVARDGRARLSYAPAAFDATTVSRLIERLVHLEQAASQQRWRDVALLTASEQQQLAAWSVAVTSDSVSIGCVHEAIRAQAARTPHATALVAAEESLTYAQLLARADQLAHHLRGLGVGPDVLVGLCCERSTHLVVGMLGILIAGGAYVPLDPAYPAERLAYMLDDAQLRVVVTHEAVRAELPESEAEVVSLDRDRELLTRAPAVPPPLQTTPSHLAYCIYTSGSTGRPKGVMVEHGQVAHFFGGMDARLGTTPGTWLAVTSVSFDISVLELCWTLTRGFTVVLYADAHRALAREATRDAGLQHTDRSVEFSLFYFSADEGAMPGDRYRLLLEGARFGDAHGFSAVWTPERHFHAFGGLYPNPAVTGAAVAAVTTRIGVRAGSCVLPLHHPVRVVEEWSVVDNLSGGRVGISFAAGWQPDDFIFQPHNYEDAKSRTVELLDEVRRLWRGEARSYPGPRGDVTVRTMPRPVQPELPVWFTTAGNPESFELAGRLGCHLLTHLLGQSVDELADKVARYRAARSAAGHVGPGIVSLMLHTCVGDDDAQIKALVRAPMKAYLATSISLIKGYAAAFPTFRRGADGAEQALDFASLSPDEMDALLEYSFERYYETSGLFGTVATCARMVDRLKGIGVDDIACLVDFGLDPETVLQQLRPLDRLRAATGPARVPRTDATVAELVRRHAVTHLQCTPSMAAMLVADEPSREALRSLRTMCVGGEAFPPALATELRTLVRGDVHNMYGPTETTIWSAMHTLDERAGAIPLGRALPHNRLYVLDRHRQPVPPGVPGELYIGGAQVVRGYWRRPELTAERFVVDPWSPEPDARMYRTGDLVCWSEDGELQFLGRTDFQVKVRGHRIELGEIEAALGALPSVREAVVMARHAPTAHGPELVAWLVWRSGAEPDVSEVRRALRSSLPDFMVPSQFVSIAAMPRTPNGKVDRQALPAPFTADTPARVSALAGVEPTGALESQIAACWQEVLGVPTVGVTDNFFDLGGHSLLAVQVHGRLQRELARSLSITDLFRFPTVRALAAHLSQGDERVEAAAALGGAARAAQRRELATRRQRRPTH
jgi:natural product biosynthesis luciferase-like monooxygenase protein